MTILPDIITSTKSKKTTESLTNFFYMAINEKTSRERQAPATPLLRFGLDLAGHQL